MLLCGRCHWLAIGNSMFHGCWFMLWNIITRSLFCAFVLLPKVNRLQRLFISAGWQVLRSDSRLFTEIIFNADRYCLKTATADVFGHRSIHCPLVLSKEESKSSTAFHWVRILSRLSEIIHLFTSIYNMADYPRLIGVAWLIKGNDRPLGQGRVLGRWEKLDFRQYCLGKTWLFGG